MKRGLALVTLLILYGSLYPWVLVPRHLDGGPVWLLLHRWDDAQRNSYLVHDVIVNVALFIPVGFSAHFVFRWLGAPLLYAGALGAAIELTQLYIPGRQGTMADLLSNIAGATLGMVLGVFFRAIPYRPNPPRVPPWAAWIFLLGLAAFRLRGLHSGPAGQFDWYPFELLLIGNQEAGLLLLARTAAAYATAIALFRISGQSGFLATALVTAAIALTELGRLWLPGADPGITDPLIAAATGFALSSVWKSTRYADKDAS